MENQAEILSSHGQFTADPLSHFKKIPWCADLLSDKRTVHIVIPDRKPKGQHTLVNETLNSKDTVKACIVYFRAPRRALRPGEDRKNPFFEISTLIDIGRGVDSYFNTCHGGFVTTIFDELMSTGVLPQFGGNGAHTVSMNLKFKKPVVTPGVVRCTGSVVKKEGRNITFEAVLAGEDGTIYAEAESAWLEMRKDVTKGSRL